MIGTIDVCPQTYSPDFPLDTLKSFVNSPSSIRIRNVPKKVGKWRITNGFVTVAYPDNTTRTIECVLTGGVYVATFEGCSSTGKVEKGLTISANGKDENDNDVTGYVLGKGDVEILEARENTSPGETVYYIHLLEDEPDVPTDGDMYKKDGNYVVYQNGVETQLGVSQGNMESYVDQKVDEAVEEVEEAIPTKTSDLTNDSNFITSEQVEPSTSYGMNGYAANSYYATRLKALDMGTSMPTDRGIIIPSLNYDSATNTYTLDLYGSVGGYYPWILRRLFGTDFSPVITLEWRKGSIYRKRVIGSTARWTVVYNNNWMWVAKGQYAITCPTGDGKPDGNFYVLNYEDETHPNYINDPATDVHTITYSNNDITSIDGQAGGQTSQTIWCTRTNANSVTIWERPFAYRDELSSFLPFDKVNSDTELGYALFPYSLTLHKPYNTPELYDNPTVFVAVGNIGNTENVVELCDDTKNEIMFGFNSDGVPQTKWGYDEEWNNVLTWPQQGGTIATKEWVEERLAQLLSQLQS